MVGMCGPCCALKVDRCQVVGDRTSFKEVNTFAASYDSWTSIIRGFVRCLCEKDGSGQWVKVRTSADDV
jgi:hypothetical protein